MRPIGCPETSVGNHHYTRRNIPEECSFLTSSEKKRILRQIPFVPFDSSSGRLQRRSDSNPVQIVSGFHAGLIMVFVAFLRL